MHLARFPRIRLAHLPTLLNNLSRAHGGTTRLEDILLDPVYSGKGAAGPIDSSRKKRFGNCEQTVFRHTGGSAALFGYLAAFDFGDVRAAA